jgi:hypothetical protein
LKKKATLPIDALINLILGIVLTIWLIFGELNLPLRGGILLWALASILVIISSVELVFNLKLAR